MAGTILQQRDKYANLFFKIIRYAALVMPFVAVGYGLLVSAGYVPKSPLYDPLSIVILSLSSILLALWQFAKTSSYSPRYIFVYLVLYHIMSAAFLILVSGFTSPLVLAWVILVIVADLNYSQKGMAYSLTTLIAVALICLSLTDMTMNIVIQHALYVAVVAITAGFVNRLRWVESVERDDFAKSKEQQGMQQTQMNTLVNSMNEAIISTNAKGVVQVYNAATLSLLDTNQSLSGKKLNDLFQTYDSDGEPVNLFESLSKDVKTLQRDDLEHRFADGEVINLGISSSVVRSNHRNGRNKIEGYILVVRDITKSKSLEEERDEFISVVSHELRTPITIAEGTLSNLQLLMERGSDIKKLGGPIKDAHDQIIYLAKMVNDLSTLSRAERGVADAPELINVADLMHELYGQYSGKAEKKGLTLNLDAPGRLGSVLASRLYLEEVLQNFITNSIKYTEKGSITLSAHRSNEAIHFSVKDTGIGISKSDQRKVFEKFYRSEDYRTRETSGTGLGLYVVQKLAHKLGVKIEVISRLNHGSTFGFSMPVAELPLDAPNVEG